MDWFDIYGRAANQEQENYEFSTQEFSEGVQNLLDGHSYIGVNSAPKGDLDYNKASMRLAYLYLYGPLHSFLVYREICSLIDDITGVKKALDTMGRLRICSLGGGPGSDVVAARAAIQKLTTVQDVSACVFDLHKGWKSSFDCLQRTSGSLSANDDYYGEVDLLKAHQQDFYQNELFKADLVTIVKFLSVISNQRAKAEYFLHNLTRQLKPGALVFYIDNAGGGTGNLFNKLMRRNSMLEVKGARRVECSRSLDTFEDSSTSLNFLREFAGTKPLDNCTVSIYTWVKPGGLINPPRRNRKRRFKGRRNRPNQFLENFDAEAQTHPRFYNPFARPNVPSNQLGRPFWSWRRNAPIANDQELVIPADECESDDPDEDDWSDTDEEEEEVVVEETNEQGSGWNKKHSGGTIFLIIAIFAILAWYFSRSTGSDSPTEPPVTVGYLTTPYLRAGDSI